MIIQPVLHHLGFSSPREEIFYTLTDELLTVLFHGPFCVHIV